MTEQAKGKIFLSSERGLTETPWFRSYKTFNFGRYQNPFKQPFGSLYVLNDDTLPGGRSLSMTVEEPTLIALLPVVGWVSYKDSVGAESCLQAGEALFVELAAGTSFQLTNPFGYDLVNFLHCWIRLPGYRKNSGSSPVSFDIDSNKNRWLPLLNNDCAKIYIAKVEGREELHYRVNERGNGLFLFVIEGAFEVQNVLLEARDGLALQDTEMLELEALSHNAIIFLIELPFASMTNS